MELYRSLLMEVFYEFNLRVYCMIINFPSEEIKVAIYQNVLSELKIHRN